MTSTSRKTRKRVTAAAAAVSGILATPVWADERPTYSFYGTPGLIEMPSAQMAPDAELAITLARFGDTSRNNFSFQLTPRITGTFRYTNLRNFRGPNSEDFFDRSFDIAYQVIREEGYWPSVTVGMRDFLGTGLYSSEYVVATKTFGPRLAVTGGLGWGRLASEGGFGNPLGVVDDYFDTRPPIDFGQGGNLTTDQWFRGPAAFFGGIEYRPNGSWAFKLEYSSDAYERTTQRGTFDPDSPINVSATWAPNENFQITGAYLYGEEFGLTGTFILNPLNRPTVGGREQAPLPVRPRNGNVSASWTAQVTPDVVIRDPALQAQGTGQILAADGIRLVGIESGATQVRVRFDNNRYRTTAQALGRVARTLTHVMPPEVEVFILEPTAGGIPISSVTLRRSDLERLENAPNATDESFARAVIGNSFGDATLTPVQDGRPRLSWSIAPYLALSTFDAEQPLLGDFGLEFAAGYELRPNLMFSASVRQRLAGNLADSRNVRPTGLEPVRSNISRYNESGTALDQLTLAYYFRPGDDLYGRVTAGYLERMFGGVSAEVLWKRPGSRFALGAEVNVVQQRDFDGGFGFQDYRTTMGHVSAYYDFANGFQAQVDVGRYLAGDWGATFALDREFANGWRVGGYFTLTDASAEDFGEGSFDKGIRVTIPTDWFLGQPTRAQQTTVLQSLTRDGGARLNVDGRLYQMVRQGHGPVLEDQWGRFWR